MQVVQTQTRTRRLIRSPTGSENLNKNKKKHPKQPLQRNKLVRLKFLRNSLQLSELVCSYGESRTTHTIYFVQMLLCDISNNKYMYLLRISLAVLISTFKYLIRCFWWGGGGSNHTTCVLKLLCGVSNTHICFKALIWCLK